MHAQSQAPRLQLPSPSFPSLARWETLSALPECGFLAAEKLSRHLGAAGCLCLGSLTAHSLPRQTGPRVLGRQLDMPTCTVNLASVSCLMSWLHLTKPLLLARGPCQLHGHTWPSFPFPQKSLLTCHPHGSLKSHEELGPTHSPTSDLLSPSPSLPWRVR